MNSNLRVIKQQDEDGIYFSIQEVEYDVEDPRIPVRHTLDYQLQGETFEALDEQVNLMDEALELPVLEAGREVENNIAVWDIELTEEQEHNLNYWKSVGLDIENMVKSTPNNMELGKKIRQYYNDNYDVEQLDLFDGESVKTI